jgi:hypothetical protein
LTKKYELGDMCSYGLHLLTKETLGVKRNGEQYCKPCLAAYKKQYLGYEGGEKRRIRKIGEFCVNGHHLTESNTFINSRGSLCCRDCAKEARDRYIQKHSDRHALIQAAYYSRNKEPLRLIREGKAQTIQGAKALLCLPKV